MRASFLVKAAFSASCTFALGLPTSTPYYPSPWMVTDGEWADAYAKAHDFVSQLTLLEKVNLTTGTGIGADRCLGNTGSVPRLNFPALCLIDTPNVAELADFQSAMPGGVNVAATFDRKLAYTRGATMGTEMLLHGGHVFLRPAVSPLGTFPEGGRNWEGFGPDPYLAGEMVAPTVTGIQDQGIVATTKHYLANEQEHFRLTSEARQNGFNITSSISENVDDRVMHELYLWPFANAVKAGTGAIMVTYNQINNSYATQNAGTLNRLLKAELGFQGFAMSDWGAHHSGVSSALAGLDMSMPGDIDPLSGASYWGANLTVAVLNGTIPEWRLDDMCMRIMFAHFKVGRDKVDIPVNWNSWSAEKYGPVHPFIPDSPIGLVNENVYVRENHKAIVREIGKASTVLLKNVDHALPLTGTERSVGIFGSDAGSNAFGNNGCTYRACNNGTLAEGWGSGSYLLPYLVTPEQAISRHVIEHTNGSVSAVTDNWPVSEQIEVLASQTDVALVFVNANSGEAVATFDGNYGDRNNLTLWNNGEALIEQVAAICTNTIVVMHTVGPVLVDSWVHHTNITAIVWAGLPGQEGGNSLVDVIYGAYNPSGRLPFTMAKRREDYGPSVLYEPNNNNGAPQQNLTDLNIDYRHFDANGIEPAFEFGSGLSYTDFEYSDLVVEKLDADSYVPNTGYTEPAPTIGNVGLGSTTNYLFPPSGTQPHFKGYIYPYLTSQNLSLASGDHHYGEPLNLPPSATNGSAQPVHPSSGGPGGNPGLWTPIYNVSVTLTNTGSCDGHEVPQIYVSLGHGEPPKVLRGFDRVWVPKGEQKNFTAQLLRRDVSFWDVVAQDWVEVDRPDIMVGRSSRKIELIEQL